MFLKEIKISVFFIPHHTVLVGNYGFILVVHVFVCCQSIHIFFLDDNLSKYQWIVTKLGTCIEIVKIWFGIANGQILSVFDNEVCLPLSVVSFPDDNWSKYLLSMDFHHTKLGMCILILWRSGFGLLVSKFHQILSYLPPNICILVSV